MPGVKKVIVYLVLIVMATKYAHAQAWEKLNFPSTEISTIESTIFGLYAGENNYMFWQQPYNGIFVSKDFGVTWQKSGLEGGLITDIKSCNLKLYATSFLDLGEGAGLFSSSDKGLTWEHLGPNLPALTVACDGNNIYLGSYLQGLWISQDNGQNWTQKTTECWSVKNIVSSNNLALADINNQTYKSIDHGTTWTPVKELTESFFNFYYIDDKYAIAEPNNTSEMYISYDSGATWNWISTFGLATAGAITIFDNRIFASKINTDNLYNTVYESDDLGETWTDTGLEAPSFASVVDSAWVYSSKPYIFAATRSGGLYRREIPKQVNTNQFLNIPWGYTNESEVLDRITSVFDHKYPLLGYTLFAEPSNENQSVVNYLGEKDKPPNIYYSSHSGYDYDLDYGTPVKAAAAGTASYYYCDACGNTIKIQHLNGLQTIYEHLQGNSLIATNSTGPVIVEEGDTIGKVGMTGNTSGPHLHFEVSKGVFPDGRIDPYGWQSTEYVDPWANFIWTDTSGIHHGAYSQYLWKFPMTGITQTIEPNTKVKLENKEVTLNQVDNPLTIILKNDIPPIEPTLKYISNTAFVIQAFDYLKNKVGTFTDQVKITINLSEEDLKNILRASLKIIYFDEAQQKWISLDSIFDTTSLTITAFTNHFSHFAVTGNRIDSNPPETSIEVLGTKNDVWYTNWPTITLTVIDPENTEIKNIFYKINNEDWQQYSEPFTISRDGIFRISYKSEDIYENLEDTKTEVICINAQNHWTKKLKIINAEFLTE